MTLDYKEKPKWDERVQWSFKHLVYHIMSMLAYNGTFSEDCVDQFKSWIDASVDESIRRDARQLVSDSFIKVELMIGEANGKEENLNFKIDRTYPIRIKNLPNSLRYNSLFDMEAFYKIPCVKEVKEIWLNGLRTNRSKNS